MDDTGTGTSSWVDLPYLQLRTSVRFDAEMVPGRVGDDVSAMWLQSVLLSVLWNSLPIMMLWLTRGVRWAAELPLRMQTSPKSNPSHNSHNWQGQVIAYLVGRNLPTIPSSYIVRQGIISSSRICVPSILALLKKLTHRVPVAVRNECRSRKLQTGSCRLEGDLVSHRKVVPPCIVPLLLDPVGTYMHERVVHDSTDLRLSLSPR